MPCRGTRWFAGLQNGKTGIDGRLPKNTSYGESMTLFAVVAERLNPSEAHKTDSIHKLEPSGSRTPLSLSRCTSGKSLLTSMRAACPALIARESPISTGPFCCGVYGAVSSRRIWRLLQYSTNVELVYSAPLSARNARGTPVSATNRCTTPKMADALLSRVPYGRWKREALSTNMTTYREPPMIPGTAPRCRCGPCRVEPLPGTWCGAVSARGCPLPSNTLSMGPTFPQVECRAVGRWLSVHSNGRGRGKRGSGQYLTLFLFLFMNTPPGESTAAAIPALPLSDSPPCSCTTLGIFTPLLALALLVLQDLLTPYFWCATGEATLRYGTGEGGPSLRWEGRFATVVSVVFAFACPPGSTLVARRDDPLLLRGNTRRPPSRWAPVLFRIISCFSYTTWNENRLKPK